MPAVLSGKAFRRCGFVARGATVAAASPGHVVPLFAHISTEPILTCAAALHLILMDSHPVLVKQWECKRTLIMCL